MVLWLYARLVKVATVRLPVLGWPPAVVRRRRQLWRARWVQRVLGVLSVLMLGLLLSQSTLAYAFVVTDHCGESCPDDERSCGCPLDCSKGCCAA